MTTAAHVTPARRPGAATWLGFVVLFAVGAAFAAWFDWTYWQPYNQLAYALAAPVLIVVGLVLFLVRRLPTLVRFGTIALVAGLAAGAVLGPSRPALFVHEATVTLRLASPVVAEVTARGGCTTVETGDQLAVFTDEVRVGEGIDELALGFHLAHGDMLGEPRGRSDGLDLLVLINRPGVPIPDDGTPSETRMISDASSDLAADVEGLDGNVAFSGLVVAPPESGSSQEPIDVAGTIEWACEP